MQCSDKVTGIFIGTQKCNLLHACIGRCKHSNCSNMKGNNIWTSTSPCEHCAAPICCAPVVKEGGQGVPRCHFQNYQNLLHGTVTKQVTVSGLKGGFPDPGLSLMFLSLMYYIYSINRPGPGR